MKKKRQKAVHCPYCGGTAMLRSRSVLSGEIGKGEWIYLCQHYPECDSYVGVNPKTMQPLGTLADPALRAKRRETHRVFDRIWKSGLMSRADAYRWLRESFGLRESQAHIALFSDYMCGQTIEKCRGVLATHGLEGG